MSASPAVTRLRCPRCDNLFPRSDFRVIAHSVSPALDSGWSLPIMVLKHVPCGAFIWKPDMVEKV